VVTDYQVDAPFPDQPRNLFAVLTDCPQDTRNLRNDFQEETLIHRIPHRIKRQPDPWQSGKAEAKETQGSSIGSQNNPMPLPDQIIYYRNQTNRMPQSPFERTYQDRFQSGVHDRD
jgi:hypothetical protein